MDHVMIQGINPMGDTFDVQVPINDSTPKGDLFKRFAAIARIKELEKI